jgi:hypothetical protein
MAPVRVPELALETAKEELKGIFVSRNKFKMQSVLL